MEQPLKLSSVIALALLEVQRATSPVLAILIQPLTTSDESLQRQDSDASFSSNSSVTAWQPLTSSLRSWSPHLSASAQRPRSVEVAMFYIQYAYYVE